jgi:hypothetical protein
MSSNNPRCTPFLVSRPDRRQWKSVPGRDARLPSLALHRRRKQNFNGADRRLLLVPHTRHRLPPSPSLLHPSDRKARHNVSVKRRSNSTSTVDNGTLDHGPSVPPAVCSTYTDSSKTRSNTHASVKITSKVYPLLFLRLRFLPSGLPKICRYTRSRVRANGWFVWARCRNA